MWGREPGTVEASLWAAGQMVQLWGEISMVPTLPTQGPFPVTDSFGVGVAIAMVLKSLDRRRYQEHQQFETIRKLCAGYSNIYMFSLEGLQNLRTVGGDKAKHGQPERWSNFGRKHQWYPLSQPEVPFQ
jgi:hypothetical protein